VASENVLPLNRFLTFSRRRGWLPQIAAGGLLLLIVGGFALNSFLASLYGPDGTAVSYVQAIGRGDTAAAWSLMTVAGGPAPAGTADLATQAGLRGWLHLEPARTGRTNVGVSGHRDVPGGVQVTVTYQDNGRTTSSQLDLVEDPAAKHFAIYPTWRVLVVPSVVSIRSPGVPYGVDGNLLNATTTAVRILPGRHVLATKPTDLFGPFATTVDVEGGQPGTATLEPKLNSSAAPGVSGVITQAFQACLANPYSGTCPAAFLQFQGNWKLIGDPGADVTVAVDPLGKPIATGHYLATVQQSFGDARVDKAVGGGYSAVLSQSGSAFKVESLSGSTSAAPLTRAAAATDSAVQQAVQAALAACIASTQANPDDCPQGLSAGLGTSASPVHWNWDSDPMAGAKVAFDDQTAIFLVTNTFAASGTYSQNLLGTSSSRTARSSGTYEAELVDDSGSLRVVTITG
jgi:hypothetical protein